MENQVEIWYNGKIVDGELGDGEIGDGLLTEIKIHMLKNWVKIIFVSLVVSMSLLVPAAQAQTTPPSLPLPSAAENYGNLIAPPPGNGETQFKLLVEGLIRNVKYIAAILAIVMITIMALRMFFAQGNEDELKKLKSGILWTLIALALIGLASDIAEILKPEDGGIIRDPTTILKRVQLFDYKVNIIITFIKYLLGSIAVVYLLRIGMRLIAASSNEENVTQDKKTLGAIAGALILIYVGDVIINQSLYKVNKTSYPGVTGVKPGVDPGAGVEEIVAFTNFVVTLAAPIAIAVLVAGAIMYIGAGGEDERMSRAKRMIIGAIIGLVVIYGAFAIVNTFIPELVTVEIS